MEELAKQDHNNLFAPGTAHTGSNLSLRKSTSTLCPFRFSVELSPYLKLAKDLIV